MSSTTYPKFYVVFFKNFRTSLQISTSTSQNHAKSLHQDIKLVV